MIFFGVVWGVWETSRRCSKKKTRAVCWGGRRWRCLRGVMGRRSVKAVLVVGDELGMVAVRAARHAPEAVVVAPSVSLEFSVWCFESG